MCSRHGAAGGNAAGDEGAVAKVSCAISRIAGLRAATCPRVVDIALVLLRG
ncbi:WD repeat domain-containing protein [Colletotrichum kahawae]|uniref:WD repeat domain-containing protein n=1 Tax=Colletotrichum kahawae TaxID=34407 RepID=A0AAD9YFY6_COLKA|nr:WD repeat domain-containing protein [Colletotrichum kahawae]